MKNMGLTLICTICLWSTALSQVHSIQVEYKFTIKITEGGEVNYFNILKDNGEQSIYLPKDSSSTAQAGRQLALGRASKYKGMFVDKLANTLVMYAPILNKDYYIKEENLTDLIEWTMADSLKKTILGYECTLATGRFRGREYEVYFTDKLPFSTGPWKLSGLPGTILEAKTVDGRFSFLAYKLTLSNDKCIISNPYVDPKLQYIDFMEHKKLSLKTLQDAQRKAQSQEKEDDIVYSFKDNSIEQLDTKK